MLVVKHAVAVPLEVFVFYLVAEFLTHALRVLGMSKAAGAVAAVFCHNAFKPVNQFLVGVESNFHSFIPPFFIIVPPRQNIVNKYLPLNESKSAKSYQSESTPIKIKLLI